MLTVTARFATVPAAFLVGCDGAHSGVRGVWGEHLDGVTFPVRVCLLDVKIADWERDGLPFPRLHFTKSGLAEAVRYKPFHWRILASIPLNCTEEEALSEPRVVSLVTRLLGAGPFERVWEGTFSIHRRIVSSFRKGRVLLAGDAAHISSPAGGQGMNSGMQDAQNLAWKLALALKGGNVETLLRSYDQERHSAIESFVLPFTTFMTRIVLEPRLIRLALSAARIALSNTQIRRAACRAFAMLGTRYKVSALILGERKWAGRRAPGARFSDCALIAFGASPQLTETLEQAASDLNGDSRIPRVTIRNISRSDPLWGTWNARGSLVAFVRPDGFVGWAELAPPKSDVVNLTHRALGIANPR